MIYTSELVPFEDQEKPTIILLEKDHHVLAEDWEHVHSNGCVTLLPAGFISDLGSVPRIPFVYAYLDGLAVFSYIPHDLHYTINSGFSKFEADMLMLGMLKWEGVPFPKRQLIYAGVVLGGSPHYNVKHAEFYKDL